MLIELLFVSSDKLCSYLSERKDVYNAQRSVCSLEIANVTLGEYGDSNNSAGGGGGGSHGGGGGGGMKTFPDSVNSHVQTKNEG